MFSNPNQNDDGAATPQWLFDLLNAQVQELTGQRFQLDAAASAWNAKCARYFDEETDALKQDWSKWSPVFCNPSFFPPLVSQFATKALEAADRGATVVLLLPFWPGYPWFQALKRRGQTQDIIGPVAFEKADGRNVMLNKGRNRTSLVVVTLGPKVAPGTNGEAIGKTNVGESVGEGRPTTAPRQRRTRRQTVAKPFTLMADVRPQKAKFL